MARTQRTRRQLDLLDRLVDLMAAEGFARFTVDDLALRMRCSKTTLYALADSKQGLVVEVVKQYFRTAVDRVEERVAARDEPAERVAAYLSAVADQLQPLSRAFMDDLTELPAATAVYRQNTAAAADRIRALVAAGVRDGAFRPVHAAFVGEMVAATMFEIQRGELFERLELTDSEAYAELLTLVTDLLTGS
jgi:AcrR family transcriptional regulator